jgi:nickel superoxide dismutase
MKHAASRETVEERRRTMNRNTRTLAFAILPVVVIPLLTAAAARAHCQIPCGIYDDKMRIAMIAEDITTLEKSMKQIVALSAQKEKDLNQIVRWIENKEDHADQIAQTVTQYFMTQRLTPFAPDQKKEYDLYLKKLTILHRMLIQAMKAKQTTDLQVVESLRTLLDDFDKAYFGTGAP